MLLFSNWILSPRTHILLSTCSTTEIHTGPNSLISLSFVLDHMKAVWHYLNCLLKPCKNCCFRSVAFSHISLIHSRRSDLVKCHLFNYSARVTKRKVGNYVRWQIYLLWWIHHNAYACQNKLYVLIYTILAC